MGCCCSVPPPDRRLGARKPLIPTLRMAYRWYYVFDPGHREWVAATARTRMPRSVLPGSTIHVHIRGRAAPPARRSIASIQEWIPGRRGARAVALLTPIQAVEAALSWRYRRSPSGIFVITAFGPVNPDLRLLGVDVPVCTANGGIHTRTITRIRERSYYPNGTRVVAEVRPDPALARAERARAAREARATHANSPYPTAPRATVEADWRYVRMDTDAGPEWVAQSTGNFQRDASAVLSGQSIAILTASHNVHLRTVAEVLDIQPLPGGARITVAFMPADS